VLTGGFKVNFVTQRNKTVKLLSIYIYIYRERERERDRRREREVGRVRENIRTYFIHIIIICAYIHIMCT
jgi:hypothetical protein